ncbi:toxin-antitoxin system HicB family antitoxin [Streptomyces sp. NBC_00988]|uniref:toxin-antitoxin system HicB family antitoxin n=1 Tax=Streptomyces sp. NBC_00988 TaxID=2903704 RepID=UPI003866CB91|nr:toxin-antitoxin system HicB family antitoxin [Streptomyces sp. NBC_00988]
MREQVVQVAGDAQAFLGDLYAKAKALAAADDRSLNSWLVSLVRRAAEDNERRSTPGT